MTRFPQSQAISQDVDDALMAPWGATGRLAPQDARLFAAALASDPAVTDDLAAARAEYAAVRAGADDGGRPSLRPLLALFAAIDDASQPVPSNVRPFGRARDRRVAAFCNPATSPTAFRNCYGRR